MTTRFSLLVALVSMLTLSAQAQVSVGVSAGANMSFWRWHIKNINTDLTFDPGIGYRAAAVADWRIGPVLGLRAEMGYQVLRSSTASKITTPANPVEVDGHFNESYHTWAGSLMASVTPFRQKRLYFLAGTSFAAITEAWNSAGADSDDLTWTAIDLKNYNRNQVFADFGAGMKFPIGPKGTLFAELRYQLPLTNLSKIENVDAAINTIGLNVGYLFQL